MGDGLLWNYFDKENPVRNSFQPGLFYRLVTFTAMGNRPINTCMNVPIDTLSFPVGGIAAFLRGARTDGVYKAKDLTTFSHLLPIDFLLHYGLLFFVSFFHFSLRRTVFLLPG